MPEYLSPGVYVEEINTGPVPIEGVSTSTTGFVGQTERGPFQPTLVTSFTEFQRWFGSFIETGVSYLPFAAKGFFDNGGKRLFVARVVPKGSQSSSMDLKVAAPVAAPGPPAPVPPAPVPPAPVPPAPVPPAPPASSNITVGAIGEGTWGNRVFIRIKDSTLKKFVPDPANPGKTIQQPVGFRLTVLYYSTVPPIADPKNPFKDAKGNVIKDEQGNPVTIIDPLDSTFLRDPNRRDPDVIEDYDNLRSDPRSPDFAISSVNPASQLIRLVQNGTVSLPGKMSFALLSGGTDGPPPPAPPAPPPPPAVITATEYIGDDSVTNELRRGLAGLDTIDEISLLCVPDEVMFPDITTEIVTRCERRKDRFAILQFNKGQGNITGEAPRPPMDSSYAAVYLPWIRIFNPVTQDYSLVPPGGHIAGIYAFTDVERGVHKAPANYEIFGMLTRDIDSNTKPLEYAFTKGQHDLLNPRGVNVIRDFRSHGRGIRVYGARTMSTDTQWKYINVRRLFIFVEQSIDRGTQWVVFEPNDESTWARVNRSITNFLITVWRSGALMGTKQEEAFFVKVDRTTMTQDDLDNGRMICYIGIAPVKPAEFVIFRISQKTLES